MTDLHRLFAHAAWADRRLLALLREHPAARTPETLRLAAHLQAAGRVWRLRLAGEDSSGQPVWPDLALEETEALAEENVRGYAALLDAPRGAGAGAAIEYANTKGERFRTRVDDVLLHVATHGGYHRGQIAAAVRRAGVAPVNTDYVTWTREVG